MSAILELDVGHPPAPARPGRSVPKILQSIVTAGSAGLLVVGFGIRIKDDVQIASAAHFAGVGYARVLTVAIDSLLIVVLLPAFLLGTMALWQDGWGRPHLLGPARRLAVWGTLFGSLVLSVLLWLAPWVQSGRPVPLSQRAPEAVAFGALAVVVGLAIPTRPYRLVGRRTLAVSALVVLTAMSGVYAAAQYDLRTVGSTLEASFAPADPRTMFPPYAIVCLRMVDAACAQRAADRTHAEVAWVPVPNTPHASVLAIPVEARFVFEQTYFPGSLGAIQLWSPAQVSFSDPLPRRLRAGGQVGSLYHPRIEDGTDVVTIQWIHGGRLYELQAVAAFRHLTSDQIDRLITLWASVRYAEPSSASAGH